MMSQSRIQQNLNHQEFQKPMLAKGATASTFVASRAASAQNFDDEVDSPTPCLHAVEGQRSKSAAFQPLKNPNKLSCQAKKNLPIPLGDVLEKQQVNFFKQMTTPPEVSSTSNAPISQIGHGPGFLGSRFEHPLGNRPRNGASVLSTLGPKSATVTAPPNGVFDRLKAQQAARPGFVPGPHPDMVNASVKKSPQKAGMHAAQLAQEKKLLARVAWSVDQNPSGPPPRMARSQGIEETGGIVQCSKDLGINCKEGRIALNPHLTKVLPKPQQETLYSFLGKVPLNKPNARKVMDVQMGVVEPCCQLLSEE